MLNKRSFISLLILGLMFCSVSVFASNLTGRNVYGILSENFTGAVQETGQDIDNIKFNTWAQYTAPSCPYEESADAKEGKKLLNCTSRKGGSGGTGGWAGFCYTFVPSNNGAGGSYKLENLSHFKYLDFWIKPISGDIAHLQFGITDNGGDQTKTLSEWGYSNVQTNQWLHCVLDLTKLSGVNLSQVKNPFLVLCNNLSEETNFYIDNVVLRTDSSSANFNITLKKVEDMQGAPNNPTQITWTEFSGWQAAAQYVEIDADKCSYAWTVRVWVNNGDASRNGLWAQGTEKEYVIPMCFRVYNGYLYNFIESPMGDASYLIGQSAASHHNLYDRGVNPNTDPGYYPWLWMKEYREINFANQEDVDSITIWDSTRGYHVAYPFDWTSGGQSGHSDGFVDFTGVDKTLRVYLGAGFGGAAGGITYTANVVFDLNYE